MLLSHAMKELYWLNITRARLFARVSEQREHAFNDVKCSELGWSCITVAVETYGCRGAEARLHLLRLASHLTARLNAPNEL